MQMQTNSSIYTSLNGLASCLVSERFLLPDTDDNAEKAILRERYRVAREEGTGFGITVGLTMKCNFACDYCYENHDIPSISPQTIERLKRHFLKRLGTFKKFAVLWFGGEPLLCIKHIKNLSSFLIRECCSHNINYRAYIITNGYLLSPGFADDLLRLGVDDFQITIDGMHESHDRSRPLRSGRGSFERIIANLRAVASRIPSLRIRTNISSQSADELKALVDILSDLNGNHNISIQLMPVHRESLGLSKSCEGCIDCHLATHANFRAWRTVVDQVEEYAISKGLNTVAVRHRSGLPYCNAYIHRCIIVDPVANCYFCTGDIGRAERRIGFLDESGELIHDTLYEQYRRLDPFAEDECNQCEMLPLCMGGCFKFAIQSGKTNGRCIMKALFPSKFPRALELGVNDPVGSAT